MTEATFAFDDDDERQAFARPVFAFAHVEDFEVLSRFSEFTRRSVSENLSFTVLQDANGGVHLT